MSNAVGVFVGLAATLTGGLILTAIGVGILSAFGGSETPGSIFLMLAGVIQLLYVIPMYRSAKAKNYEGLKVGLVIGAAIVFLFNAACGALIQSFSSPGAFR